MNGFLEPGSRPTTLHSWLGQQAPVFLAATHLVFFSFHDDVSFVHGQCTDVSAARKGSLCPGLCPTRQVPSPEVARPQPLVYSWVRQTHWPSVGGLFCTKGDAELRSPAHGSGQPGACYPFPHTRQPAKCSTRMSSSPLHSGTYEVDTSIIPIFKAGSLKSATCPGPPAGEWRSQVWNPSGLVPKFPSTIYIVSW